MSIAHVLHNKLSFKWDFVCPHFHLLEFLWINSLMLRSSSSAKCPSTGSLIDMTTSSQRLWLYPLFYLCVECVLCVHVHLNFVDTRKVFVPTTIL